MPADLHSQCRCITCRRRHAIAARFPAPLPHLHLCPTCSRRQSSPGSSQGLRSSSASGGTPPTSSTTKRSSDGSGRSPRFAPSSPLARALSGMTVSIQRGISGAGDVLARTLSGAGLRPLSQHGSAAYERLEDTSSQDAAMAMGDASTSLAASHPHTSGGVMDGRAGRSRLGPSPEPAQLHQQHHLQPSRFFLPGVSVLPADASHHHTAMPGSPTAVPSPGPGPQSGSGQRPRSPAAAGWPRPVPVPGSASLLGHGGPSERPAQPEGPGLLQRPAGLARIRTRPKERSGSGNLQPAQGVQAAGSAAAGEPVQPLQQLLQPSSAPPAAATISGVAHHTGAQGIGAAEDSGGDGSSRRWRTRQDYQASLAAGGSPIAARSRENLAQDRRAPSEPGQASRQHVRGHAGLRNFVATPTGMDATNR